jgi:hypothetical protein
MDFVGKIDNYLTFNTFDKMECRVTVIPNLDLYEELQIKCDANLCSTVHGQHHVITGTLANHSGLPSKGAR